MRLQLVALLLSLTSSVFGSLGVYLMYRCGDANRKFELSVRSVGLMDEEPEDSPRRIAEKNNRRCEKAGFGLVMIASVLGFVSAFLQWRAS
jgi:hypothetical protein